MNEEYMMVVMGIIMHGGNAKGLAFQAIQQAKAGDFEEAEKSLQEANMELKEAHDTQTDMLTRVAQGEQIDINLYMVHAQDHLMNAITFKDLAVEVVGQEKRIQALENK
ncbi:MULTISPECIES: PTS lactose/cellobiose transporter subunit IIA [unclassified Lactococcus]|uniref:PTS lactose/cellobiose transporter subunit IIA n=1 Tax=unclassified Lactococcus TaxID=2643510 RepID=UPI0011C837BE|nr:MULTISPECIES: PTS lactose/cellobiose transporter subunit IIA [unclassified Lactococcus]MQW23929.1 PTS lactose/cellobiose transporter subunit IIA [Lactococcus sp. dk101]TXK37155.1 PTS lactose/cellobiose transporter subunit IIA [Lactococcus sp. dk310]TXK48009.1 PTS lactose/cellobiose transporter subunit IIA [Lactococcus sp. dk322]